MPQTPRQANLLNWHLMPDLRYLIQRFAICLAFAIAAMSPACIAPVERRDGGQQRPGTSPNETRLPANTAHLALGNPSNATGDTGQPDNYLVTHASFALSYNNSRGTPNWVSWVTTPRDLGDKIDRSQFRPDMSLANGLRRIQYYDYSGSGYDRGHMVPSADRFGDPALNAETFLMTNIVPQTPDLNQFPWQKLESYVRSNVRRGSDAYTIAGVYGDAGRIRDRVTIPTNCWKVILLVRTGTPPTAIGASARVIAVDMPNVSGIAEKNWREYRTTIREIERRTGYDLLSSLPVNVQEQLETQVGQ